MAAVPWKMHLTIIWTAAGLGGVGLFSAFAAHADIAVISAAWTGMLVTLAVQAGHSLSKDGALKIVAGILFAVGGLAGGIKLANTYFAYTGVGTVPAMIVNAGANATLTYIVGKAAAKTFMELETLESAERVVVAIIAILKGGSGGDSGGA
jgi:uncharacterized protein (DUF697 family)